MHGRRRVVSLFPSHFIFTHNDAADVFFLSQDHWTYVRLTLIIDRLGLPPDKILDDSRELMSDSNTSFLTDTLSTALSRME